MNRSVNKILSMVLAVLMLASVMCMSVSAAKFLAVNKLDVTVTEPVPGEIPVFEADFDANNVAITQVIWWRVDDETTATAMKPDERFVEGLTYECDIRFQISDEKALFTESVTGTVNGETVETYVNGTFNVCTLYAYFVCEAAEDDENHTHIFDDWYETEEPSCTQDGEKERVCTICGETETEVIPAYGNHTDDDENKVCDTCGDILKGADSSADEATKDEEPATDDEATDDEATDDEPATDDEEPADPSTDDEDPADPVVDKGISGDVNGDGKVNIKDATQIQKAAAKILTLTEAEALRADVNADNKVNIKDATAIQKYVAKIETGLPIGEKVI